VAAGVLRGARRLLCGGAGLPPPLVAPPEAYSITEGKEFLVVGAEPVVLGALALVDGTLVGFEVYTTPNLTNDAGTSAGAPRRRRSLAGHRLLSLPRCGSLRA
jgi:hypothetical protein